MTDCLFCKIIQETIPATRIYEDEQVIVIKDIHPRAPVHLLVIPKKHVVSLNELSPEDAELITHMTLLLPKLALKMDLAQGFRTIINTGKGGGQEIFHLHIHLLGGGPLPFA